MSTSVDPDWLDSACFELVDVDLGGSVTFEEDDVSDVVSPAGGVGIPCDSADDRLDETGSSEGRTVRGSLTIVATVQEEDFGGVRGASLDCLCNVLENQDGGQTGILLVAKI